MLYEFKCRATGPVVMMQPTAERLLSIIGKPAAPTGIVLPEQMPAAIAALEAAVAEEQALRAAESAASSAEAAERDVDERETREPAVTLAQRAWPFIELLKAAHAAEREVTWGV